MYKVELKSIIISALAISLVVGAAGAQGLVEDVSDSGIVSADDMNRLIRSETIMDSPIYTLASEGYDEEEEWEESEYYEGWQDTEYYDAVGEGWEQVGEVEDIVLSPNGDVVGIIAEVGGFLGIGESKIVLDLRDVKLVRSGVAEDVEAGVEEGVGVEAEVEDGIGDEAVYGGGDIYFVTRYSQEQLENLETIGDGWF